MIWESWPWKQEISRRAAALEKRKGQRKWRQESFAAVEMDVMLAAYAVRKLFEAKKLSDALRDWTVTVYVYKNTGKRITHSNWHRLPELYDLENQKPVAIKPEFLVNQIIHSYVFMLSIAEDNGMSGFFVASDRQRAKGLYLITLGIFVHFLRQVAEDSVVSMHSIWDESRLDYVISNYAREMPIEEL